MTGFVREPNALLGYMPTDAQLQSELERLARFYGASKVKAAAAKLRRERRGRKEEADFIHLAHVFSQDAKDWLDGLDPFTMRRNYAIAKEFSQKHPGHSAAATHRRLMGKLAKRRRHYCFIAAVQQAKSGRPIPDLLRAMTALLQSEPIWATRIDYDLRRIEENSRRYKELTGQDVPQDFTFDKLEEATKVSAETLLSGLKHPNRMFGSGLGGLFGRQTGKGPAGLLGAGIVQSMTSEENQD